MEQIQSMNAMTYMSVMVNVSAGVAEKNQCSPRCLTTELTYRENENSNDPDVTD
jgi:hypothetical protein